MPSFDVVSEVDKHELSNAVDQTTREITTRYDFKGSNASIELGKQDIRLIADSEFQLDQILTVLYQKMAKRKIDVACLKPGEPFQRGRESIQTIAVQEGIEPDLARKMIKLVKASKLKVQAAIQGEQLRITGKKRDDLQATMQVFKEASLGIPLQYVNFRD